MSLHYNVLPEAVCCYLLVNHVVYKCVSITSLYVARKPTYPQNFMSMASMSVESEGKCVVIFG